MEIILNLIITAICYLIAPFILTKTVKTMSKKLVLTIAIINALVIKFLLILTQVAVAPESLTSVSFTPTFLWGIVSYYILSRKFANGENVPNLNIKTTKSSNQQFPTKVASTQNDISKNAQRVKVKAVRINPPTQENAPSTAFQESGNDKITQPTHFKSKKKLFIILSICIVTVAIFIAANYQFKKTYFLAVDNHYYKYDNTYWVIKNGSKFHSYSCSVIKIAESKTYYLSSTKAYRDGFLPCPSCLAKGMQEIYPGPVENIFNLSSYESKFMK